MDIGTTIVHTDADDNTYAGQICGRDFELRPVWRSKAGEIRRQPDGRLADKGEAKDDTTKTEKVDTGLFVVKAIYRDGQERILLVDPGQLTEAPAFDSKVVFSHDADRGDFEADDASDPVND